jgi:hypothetical protein
MVDDIVAEIGIPRFFGSGGRLGIAYVIRDDFCSLFLERATPSAWSYANNADEVSREMA